MAPPARGVTYVGAMMGPSSGHLGPAWGHLGATLAKCGLFGGHRGANLGHVGAIYRQPTNVLGDLVLKRGISFYAVGRK